MATFNYAEKVLFLEQRTQQESILYSQDKAQELDDLRSEVHCLAVNIASIEKDFALHFSSNEWRLLLYLIGTYNNIAAVTDQPERCSLIFLHSTHWSKEQISKMLKKFVRYGIVLEKTIFSEEFRPHYITYFNPKLTDIIE